MSSDPEARASGEHRCEAFFEVLLRDGFSLKRKMNSQSVRDNNAAWVAGPGRICFLQPSKGGMPPIFFLNTFPTTMAFLGYSPLSVPPS